MAREDITTEFYYRKAVYTSKITGVKVPITIKGVYNERIYNTEDKLILSSNNVFYYLSELTDLSI